MNYRTMLIGVLAVTALPAHAGEEAFSKGPVFEDFGPVAEVDLTYPIAADAVLKHSFDVSKSAEEGELNRTLQSAARFINMHSRAGLPEENIHVAVVVHGGAVNDVSRQGAGANAKLIKALTDHGVEIVVCGQSAAYYEVKTADLLPGVKMALSAMTAHAMLQGEGYTVNPF